MEVSEKVKNAHVLIATPNYMNLWSAEAGVSFLQAMNLWTEWGVRTHWQFVGRTFVQFARTQLCQVLIESQKLERPYTHIYWVDDDAVVTPEDLPRLIDHDKEVIVTPYPMRRFPHEIGVLSAQAFLCPGGHTSLCAKTETPPLEMPCPECGKTAKRDFHNQSSYRNLNWSDMDQGLIQIDGGGTHAMLCKREIFYKQGEDTNLHLPPKLKELRDRLTDADLDTLDHFIGELPNETLTLIEEDEKGKPFFQMPKVGTEDMLFCYRLKKKGVEVWCDTDAWADHVGFAPVVTKEMAQRAEELKRGKEELYRHSGVPVLPVSNGRGNKGGATMPQMRRNEVDTSKAAGIN